MALFGKADSDTDAADQQDGGRGGKVALASVSRTQVAAVVGNRLVYSVSMGPGCAVTTEVVPLPPGHVVAVDASGPACLTSDGWLWALTRKVRHGSELRDEWQRVFNVRDEAAT